MCKVLRPVRLLSKKLERGGQDETRKKKAAHQPTDQKNG